MAATFSQSAWITILQGLEDLRNSDQEALGANVVLCSGTNQVQFHETLIRRFTVIFDGLPEKVLSDMMDENDKLTIIIPSVSGASLTALADFLYTGQAVCTTCDIKKDLEWMIVKDITLSCSGISKPSLKKKQPLSQAERNNAKQSPVQSPVKKENQNNEDELNGYVDISDQVKIERKSAWRKYRLNYNNKTAICIECREIFKLDPRSRLGWTTRMAKHSNIKCRPEQYSNHPMEIHADSQPFQNYQESKSKVNSKFEVGKTEPLFDASNVGVDIKLEGVKEEDDVSKCNLTTEDQYSLPNTKLDVPKESETELNDIPGEKYLESYLYSEQAEDNNWCPDFDNTVTHDEEFEGTLQDPINVKHHPIAGNEKRLDEEICVKPYHCSSCDKAFKHRSTMMRHERTVHQIVSTEGGPLPKERKPRCGDCTGCQRADDCKECPACLDKRKYGGPGILRRVCR